MKIFCRFSKIIARPADSHTGVTPSLTQTDMLTSGWAGPPLKNAAKRSPPGATAGFFLTPAAMRLLTAQA